MLIRLSGWCVVLVALVSLPFASVRAQKPPALPDLLTVASDSVARYAQELGTVAADEEFVQYETSSGRMSTPKRLNSLVVLYAQGDGAIVNFRDLVGIDTVPVRARDDRLAALFTSPSDASLASAQEMTEAAVKAYFSPNLHLLDRPLLALDLIRAANQPNSTFKIEGTKKMDGASVAVLKFNEKGTGHLMNDAAAIGRVWIEPDSGVIHQTELGFVSRAANITATVKLARDETLGMFVPVELFEQVQASAVGNGTNNMGAASGSGDLGGRQSMEGRARYSAYRRISVHR
jgi:hypothetical protein